MIKQNPYETYSSTAVNTASPGELTLMLYNGCLRFINQAKKAIYDNNIESRNINIQKAQAIIQELIMTLNTNIDIADNMHKLYDYIYHRLMEANIQSDLSALEEVEGFIVEFRDTWKEVIKKNRQLQYAGASGRV